MPARRSPGAGSYYKTTNGWVGALVTYDAAGRRTRIYRRGSSKRAVMAAIRQVEERIAEGRPARDSTVKLADFLPRWLEDKARPTVKPRTYETYRWAVAKLTASLGTQTLATLTPERIDHAYAQMVRDGLKPSSIQVIHAVVHLALDQARRWKYVSASVAIDATPPRVERGEHTVLAPEQLGALLDEIEAGDDELLALWMVLATTGLRISEALGLRWSDVDLDGRRLQVSVQLSRDRSELVEPKTRRSRRGVYLTSRVVLALQRHRRAQAAACTSNWPESDLVFRTAWGLPWVAGTVRRRWYRLLEIAGLPRMRPHDLRHTVASIMLADGVPDIVVSEMLGHSTITETVDTYGHVLPGSHAAAVARFERRISGADAGSDAVTDGLGA